MAEQELPLVEIAALPLRQTAYKNYQVAWVIPEIEHQRMMDAFLRGPSGKKKIILSVRVCPPDWEAPPVNPDQGDDEIDQTSRLQEEWQSLISRMTSDGDLPT